MWDTSDYVVSGSYYNSNFSINFTQDFIPACVISTFANNNNVDKIRSCGKTGAQFWDDRRRFYIVAGK